MSIQTAQEQLVLELINRARLDPNAEAARYRISLNEGLSLGSLSSTARQPLAMNDDLIEAARAHSRAMISLDFFDHVNPSTGRTPFDRIEAAGFDWMRAGENIAFRGSSGPLAATQAVIEQLHRDLFVDKGIAGRGHRKAILNSSFEEVGNGVATGRFNTSNAVMLTEDFGTRDTTDRIITGVAFNDTVRNDNFYTIGEGHTGVRITAGGSSTTANSAGGYSLGISASTRDVTFSGNAFDTPITVKIYSGSTNVKLDVVDGDTIYSSISVSLISGAAGVNLLGIANLKAIGSAANETLNGNNGNNTLDGAGGKDALNGNAGRDVLIGGDGHDVITGGTGNDILRGGLGRDIMRGDKDADDFDFNSVVEIGIGATRDIIRDFEHLVDDIDLATIDANGAAAGHAFTFLAARGAAFTGAAGQLRWFQENLSGASNDKTIVEGDVNGDAIADFQIQLSGLKTLTSADFIL